MRYRDPNETLNRLLRALRRTREREARILEARQSLRQAKLAVGAKAQEPARSTGVTAS